MANVFTPRLSAPSTSNKWYLHTSKGGYNNSILVGSPSVLANCVGYARGRFSEIAGSWQNIANSDGGKIWGNTTGFQKGSKPRLGAIICWSKPGYAGHVAVVEQVNADGSIVTSESGYKELPFSSITTSDGHYNGKAFWTGKYYPSNGYCSGAYIFQGFIYNPAVVGDEIVINSNGIDDGGAMSANIARLYDGQELSGKEDATLREVAYVDSRSEPSILSTDVKLSVINYTSMLAAIFNTLTAPYAASSGELSGDVNLDNLNNVPRQIIQYFINKGLPAAAGVGIAANVQGECSFNIGQKVMDSNNKYSYGMCMWNASNGTAMVDYVGSNWRTNLTGQCNFLWYDMTERQPGWFKYMMNLKYGRNITILDALNAVPNSLQGAKQATDIFIRVYENPGDPDGGSIKRQGFAEDIWNKIVPQLSPN